MNEELQRAISQYKHVNFLTEIKNELLCGLSVLDKPKDIIIIVKDQLPLVKNCIESIIKHTNNYNLYIWDNASNQETKEYLYSISAKFIHHSKSNMGFLEPNNRLAELTDSPYIILLNSDTEVKSNWDKVMIGWLENHPDIKEVGYAGCVLNEEFKGGEVAFGYEIDYVPGWAVCISRETYQQFGLFDENNLHFGYCEDSDLSLRIKEAGFKVYALHAELVLHFENGAFKKNSQNEEFRKWFAQIFAKNHLYMKTRWGGKGLIRREYS